MGHTCSWLTFSALREGGLILSFLLAKTFCTISPLLLMNDSDTSELRTGKREERQEEQGSFFLWELSW